MLVKGAVALTLAGFRRVRAETGLKGKTIVVVLCGGNFGVEVMRSLLA